ncbi:hypothetical protein ACEPAH_3882 [Sanghuangporus vaninii]
MPSHQELYAQMQRKHKLGYALFDPSSGTTYDKVRVGDVGYIDDAGTFMKLFNVFHTGNDKRNTDTHLPDGFTPIAKKFTEIDVNQSVGNKLFISASVRQLKLDGSAKG